MLLLTGRRRLNKVVSHFVRAAGIEPGSLRPQPCCFIIPLYDSPVTILGYMNRLISLALGARAKFYGVCPAAHLHSLVARIAHPCNKRILSVFAGGNDILIKSVRCNRPAACLCDGGVPPPFQISPECEVRRRARSPDGLSLSRRVSQCPLGGNFNVASNGTNSVVIHPPERPASPGQAISTSRSDSAPLRSRAIRTTGKTLQRTNFAEYASSVKWTRNHRVWSRLAYSYEVIFSSSYRCLREDSSGYSGTGADGSIMGNPAAAFGETFYRRNALLAPIVTSGNDEHGGADADLLPTRFARSLTVLSITGFHSCMDDNILKNAREQLRQFFNPHADKTDFLRRGSRAGQKRKEHLRHMTAFPRRKPDASVREGYGLKVRKPDGERKVNSRTSRVPDDVCRLQLEEGSVSISSESSERLLFAVAFCRGPL